MYKLFFNNTLIALGYFLLGEAGLLLAIPPGYASPIFPASAIGLVAVLQYGWKVLPGVFLSSLCINLIISSKQGDFSTSIYLVSISIATGAIIQAWIGAKLVQYRIGYNWKKLINDTDIIKFLLLGSVFSTLVSCSWATASLLLAGFINSSDLFFTWWNWWIGDSLGSLLFSPLLLAIIYRNQLFWKIRFYNVFIPIFFLFTALVCTFLILSKKDYQAEIQNVNKQGEEISYSVELALLSYQENVNSLARLFTISPALSGIDFDEYTSPIFETHKDIDALSWNPFITSQERKNFERFFGKENNLADFKITERDATQQLVPANIREWYVAVGYISPKKGNEKALGFDIASNPTRLATILSSMQSGKLTATPPIHLVQDNNSNGLLLLQPVYDFQETKKLKGFAVGVFKIERALSKLVEEKLSKNLLFKLEDLDTSSENNLLYSNFYDGARIESKMIWTKKIDFAGRHWQMTLYPTNQFLVEHRSLVTWVILAMGLVVASLLQAMLLGITGREFSIRQLVDQRTLALDESEKRFRLIIEHSPIPVALNDGYQNIIFLNQAFTETFGYDLNDIPKLDIWWNKAYPDENYRKWVIETWEQTLTISKQENKMFSPFEVNVICKDGSQKVVIADSSILSGLVDYHLVTLYDITERKKSESLIQESEKKFRTVADAAPVLIWLANTDKLCIWFNKTWLNFTGRTLEQEYGNGWAEGVHPDDFQRCLDTYITCFDNRQSFSMEYRLKNSQGDYRWLLDTGVPVFNSEGEFDGYIGSCVDITEQINSFEELKNSQSELQLLTSMIEDSQDPFYVLDINDGFRMIFTNDAASQHYGLPKEKLLTMRVPDWDPDVNFDKLSELLPVLREEKHLFLKTRHLVSDGIIPVEISINYLKNEKSEYAFGYIIDLKERIELENAMFKAKENAELLAKSKSEFLANMSHEIRTPMTAIIGLSQLSLNKEMPDDIRDSLTKIYQSSNSLLGILNDILDFSKLDAGKLTLENSAFSLVTVFRNLHNLFSFSAKTKNLEFSISVEHDVPNELIGDALRIQQILSNLLGNAIKFTEHGKIELRIKQIENRLDETLLRFTVEDTGVGIKEEHQENLFKPFHQADNSITRRFGGTGLGLTISRDLLHLMGSDFHVNSVEGKGTIIYFDLLLKISNSITSKPHDSLSSNQQGTLKEKLSEVSKLLTGAKILLAEDNSLNQEIVGGFLKMSGIEVDIADNGIIALGLLKSNSYDAILMDIHMPEMDGLEATKRIREQSKYADLPIIALTAGITKEEQEKCLSTGMNNLVEKPINPEVLLQTLSRYIKDI